MDLISKRGVLHALNLFRRSKCRRKTTTANEIVKATEAYVIPEVNHHLP
ncbi:hypothetical protein [Bacillus pakistanensis]|nr:hypothetical protein [Bacillus pakistanensis]